MNWAHLPVGGGLYDQSPELLDAFRTIFSIQAEHDAEERKRDEEERKRTMGNAKSRGRSRPRSSGRH
jgi:hypothetical protein